MKIVKDSMVLIHLAKLSLLEKSCDFFKKVIIPELVEQEINEGKTKGFPDAVKIFNLISDKKIKVEKIKDKELIKKVNQFNIQRGEAEVIALYWESRADIIATDDDNIRKKKLMLNIKIIGTPAIILNLYRHKIITKNKLEECVVELRKIGWFSNAILDTILMEAKND